MPATYNWKRYWCPRGGMFQLAAGGYFADPESEWGKLLKQDIFPFDAIANTPCLILLGEPGIGKSRAIEDTFK